MFPTLVHADFDYPKAALSLFIAVLGIGIAAFFWFQQEELGPLKGLTERNKFAHAGYTFLENKYYLDYLYEDVIVAGIKGPIARGAYWINQNVIDGVVNAIGAVSAEARAFHLRHDRPEGGRRRGQRRGRATGDAGGLLRYFQSGRVQRYALLLFGAVGILALALLLANS